MHFSRFTAQLALLFACFAIVGTATAQSLSNPVTGAEGKSFADYERSFSNWRSNHDLTQEKGWKYYGRWQNYHAQRLNPDGSLYDPATLYREAVKVNEWKQRLAGHQRGGSGWIPVGPVDRPPGADPSRQHGLGRVNCITFHPTDPDTYWVGVAQGGVWKTVDDGQNWQPLTDELPILRINDIAVDPNHPDTMYIAVGDYAYLAVGLELDDRKRNSHFGMGVYKTVDGGNTWAPTALAYNLTDFDGSLIRRTFVHPTNSDQLIAAGIEGIFSSADGGDSWTTVMDSVIWDIEADPSDPMTLYATGGYINTLDIGYSAIWKSTDFGATWVELNTGLQPQGEVGRIEVCVAPSNPNYVYAIACGASHRGLETFMRSTDGGTTWTEQLSGAQRNILNWSDGTAPETGQGTYDLVLNVHPSDEERVYAGGINLWSSGDGGVNWEGVSYWLGNYGESLHADQHFLARNPHTNDFFMCNDGGVYRTDSIAPLAWALAENGTNWPTEWENLSSGLAVTSFYRLGLSANNPGRLLAGAQDNSTFITDGVSWLNIIGGDGMECISHPDNPSIIWGSWQYGSISKSINGGLNSQSISGQISWNYGDLGEWTTPYSIHPTNPDLMYAAYGNVYISYDGGDNFTPISDFPLMEQDPTDHAAPASALALAPSHPSTVYVAKRIYHGFDEPTRVWHTNNYGNDWTDITAGLPDSLYITYMTVDDNDPDHAWATCGGFIDGVKVFETEDAGATWENISSNLPNLPANTIIHHNLSLHNVVYVGMDIGIYYTNDTLSTWELYNENLPNVIVSELEIDYTDKKLYAATFGRGIWKSDLLTIEIDTTPAPVDTMPIDTTPPAFVDVSAYHALTMSTSPNPASGAFTLSVAGTLEEESELRILDIRGGLVHQEQFPPVAGTLQRTIDPNLPAGVYFLQLTNGSTFKATRLVITD